MDMIIVVFLILLFSLALVKSTGIVISNVIRLARRFSVPEFAVGFFILGFATSLPEIFVAVNSVIDKSPQLSLGNLLGASFVLLTLIISIPAVITGKVEIKKVLSTKDIALSSFIIALPALFSLDGNLTRLDGMILLSFYVMSVYMLNKDESFVESIKTATHKNRGDILKLLSLTLLGVLGVFIASKIVVELALSLAQILYIPALLVGVLFLSIGTNLPELSLAIKTSFSKHKIIGVGDFLGSASVNTFVISLLCLASPFQVTDLIGVRIASVFVILSVVILAIFMRTKRQLTRKEGFALLLLYSLFIFFELYGKRLFS